MDGGPAIWTGFWTEEFTRYSALHAGSAAGWAALIVGLCWWGARLRRRDEAGERRLRLWLAWFAGVTYVGATIFWALPARWDVGVSLPLHLCDIAGLLAPLALALRWRLPRALVYFWGLGLSVWGFVSPVLTRGPAAPEYWVFWLTHTQIVGTGVYLLWVVGYRPRRRDLAGAIGALACYAAVMVPVNAVLGTDYGFIGVAREDARTVLHEIGAWPWRIAPILLGEALLMVLLWLPWRVMGDGGTSD